MRALSIIALCLLFSLMTLKAHAKTKPQTLKFGDRAYTIEIPDGDTPKPASTVFVLHGGGGTGKQLRKHFSFSRLAADTGAVLVYPDGLNGHWNDGREIYKKDAPDDVAFLSGLAGDLVKRGISSKGKIYVVGVSNGGMMTQRLLCEASETFTAGASIIAGLPATLKGCKPKQARPLLMINGDADPIMPWKGGGVGFRGKRGDVLSGMDTLAHWQNVNGCRGEDVATKMANRNIKDKTRPVKYSAECTHLTEMIRIKNGGHNIPMLARSYRTKSKRYKRRKKLLGRYNHDFSSRDVIWDFFKRAGL